MMSPMLVLWLVLAVIVLVAVVVAGSTAAYQWRLRRHHGIARSAFVESFAGTDVRPEIAAAVYDYYKSEAVWPKFAVSPADGLQSLLERDDEAIGDDLELILRSVGLKEPSKAAQKRHIRTLNTVADVVHWVAWAADNQPEESGGPASDLDEGRVGDG